MSLTNGAGFSKRWDKLVPRPMSVPPITATIRAESPSATDARWFEEEVQAHEPALRAYLHRQFPSLADPEDVIQESYLRLWRVRSTARIESARAYLFTIARNATLALFRRQRCSPEVRVERLEALPVADEVSEVVPKVCLQDEIGLVVTAIDTLPRRCREVVLLRAIQGLSYAEIGQRLGISEHTARIQMAKGLKRCIVFFRERSVTR